MKVSIIIPAYNVEKYIRKCLNSAIKQTFEETQYEIIVINDCSKDQTLKILKKHKSKFKNFNIITNKKTKGPGLSRNIGIKHSSGKYIFFLDGDDFIRKDTISKLYKKAIKLNADVVGYNFTKILKSNKKISYCRIDINKITLIKKKLIKNFLYGEMDGSVIYSFIKRDIILKNKIYFKKGLHEDILFIFKVYFFSKKIAKYNKNFYYKIDRSSSILNTFNSSRIIDLINAFKDCFLFLKKRNKIMAKKYFHFYIRGLVGCIGKFLMENLALCKNKKKRYLNYLKIYKNVKKDFNKIKLPKKTFRDKITKIYLDVFKSKKNLGVSLYNFEKEYKKLERL